MVRHGEAGLIVSQEDPESMAKAIITLLENPDRALNMTRLAREEVAAFTWPKVKKEWGEVYMGNNKTNQNTMTHYVTS
jgi:glycosyltransferase involved in cell wall biosynthesis